ncbi:esterase [Cryptococcus bacillisporus CA1873]|uniref:Esterase n=1 Tax=Cryptococcus bacillisporus CA1873 TaxID=1296111 RepID=A0ABR5B416_CRYGA|nr:esterase [Cryptococcus bacillisporus CA1873]|eukprot:KIR58330.1 esterase [Cryptococcus gattii CA1873]
MPSSTLPTSRPLPLRHLLETYTTSHPLRTPSPLPPSSRVDPKLRQRLPPPTSASPLLWTLPTWWLFIRFVFAKGIHIALALISHFLFGPKRPSWGYRMTFITSFMRNIADHSSLADIALIRRFISLHFLVPLPGDAVVTPITFTVPPRKAEQVARGFLRDLDVAETGSRQLSGEWVVGTEVWKRLRAEKRARQKKQRASPRYNLSPNEESSKQTKVEIEPEALKQKGKASERVIYYVHGGAYYVGNAATHRLVTIGVSKSCNARVFAITYRLAPEHVFPLPLHDVLLGYLRLLSPPLSIPPENIIIAGDSAGGGLSLALCMYLRDEGYRLPAGLVLMSPWVDLTMSCGSWDENADSDVVPRPETDDHLNPVGCYLGPEGIATYLTHPYASPLFGDFHGLPPMLIQSGDSEVLRDEITLVAHKATLAGVNVTHELYEDMVHVFQMFSFLPATMTAINNVGVWVRTTLPKIEKEQRQAAGMDKDQQEVGALDVDVTESMEEEIGKGNRVVAKDGQEIGVRSGRTEVMSEEIDATQDLSRQQASTSKKDFSRRSINERPTVDTDSLAKLDSDSDSGSPTPTNSRLFSPSIAFPREPRTPPRHSDPFLDVQQDQSQSSQPHTLPRLRRVQTTVPMAFALSPPPNPLSSTRRRRPTTSSLLTSPSSFVYGQDTSYPASPTSSASARKRLRSGTLSFQPRPTTRIRSKSHSDIFNLVEGYVEGGAANETTVYAPGGEVKSVGVLGEDEEE